MKFLIFTAAVFGSLAAVIAGTGRPAGSPSNSAAATETTNSRPAPATESEKTYDHQGRQLALPETVSFNAHIRGIMSNTCFTCHGPDPHHDTTLRLDSFTAAVDEGGAIEPNDAEASLMFQRITDADDPMPPADFLHQLSDYEKALFKKWIDDGAKYEQHWAYAPIERPPVPKLQSHQSLVKNPIDAFIFARLEREGLTPSPEADRAKLLRRLSLDLIGLPPTPDELAEFLADDRQDAYERQVDRLLASPQFGERMSAFWLDLVRFSDTVGFHGDQNQRIFPYRDFVIDSINRNQPFDEFTRDQLAGDLLDNPTDAQRTATGLIRLNMMTREGGAQPEEYLAKYTADRVRMLGTAWLGSTTGCCECHNHKYDPFSIEDFYSLGAFFDDVRQWGVYTDYQYSRNPDLARFSNNHPFPPEFRHRSASLQQQLRFLEKKLESAAAKKVDSNVLASEPFQQWMQKIVDHQNESANDAPHGQFWRPLTPTEVFTEVAEKAQTLDDGSVRFSDAPKPAQLTTLKFEFDQATDVRAIRMEVIPDAANKNRVGRGKAGRFSASIEAEVLDTDANPPGQDAVKARYVRIERDNNSVLSLAEVQVFSMVDGQKKNIARQGKAKQSTTQGKFEAAHAIDGRTGGDQQPKEPVAETLRKPNPWWEVDLLKEQVIDRVTIWAKTGKRVAPMKGLRLVLLDQKRNVLYRVRPAVPNPSTEIEIPADIQRRDGRKLKIAYAVADRRNPSRYYNGQPSPYLEPVWRSGPTLWQLPVDETKLQHHAVFALDRTSTFGPQRQLLIQLKSRDVGRVRFSIAPLARPVAGRSAGSEHLTAAVNTIAANWQKNRSGGPNVENRWRALPPLSIDQQNAVKAAYFQSRTPLSKLDAGLKQIQQDIAKCRSGLAMTLVSVPVEPEKSRKSRVLPRGNWQDKSGSPVNPNTPHFLPGHNTDKDKRMGRLDLANWLTSKQNPLPARHYVNRVWAQFFGTGLSGRVDDLGNQGEWPSHPLLIDWLASEFQDGWDRKRIIRLMVTSHTYRQSAATDRELHQADPYNRLLGQQAARRLEAEIVRDNALSISGLLNIDWIGGPSVTPYQPPGYYSNLQFPNRKYLVQTDGRQYRRGVYMHWQRTFLHPMLNNFDAPARDECVALRNQSNSPQQALTLLNDPVFNEAARAFAVRIVEQSKAKDIQTWIATGFRLAVAREPKQTEVAGLIKFFDDQNKYYQSHPDEAEAFLSIGEYADQPPISRSQFAALGQVCRVILNLHETITRY